MVGGAGRLFKGRVPRATIATVASEACIASGGAYHARPPRGAWTATGTASVKILSDFDGVWTDPTHEAVAVVEGLADELARATGFARERVLDELDHCRRSALAAAELHGWRPSDRLTAYCDEDAFLEVSGIASYLEAGTCDVARAYRERLAAAEGPSFMQLADQVFRRLGARAGVGVLLPEGPAVLAELEELGVEMVVVSNSDTEKLVRLFGDAGIDAGEDEGHRVRVRGGARKWSLGEEHMPLEFAGRVVDVNRPHYRAIIEEIDPDLIVGDVFSLDLALPLHMRACAEPCAPTTLVHRPPAAPTAWVADHLTAGRVDAVAPTLADLVHVVRDRVRVS